MKQNTTDVPKVHKNIDTDVWHTSRECAGTNDTLIFSGDYETWGDGRACPRCGANELRKKMGE